MIILKFVPLPSCNLVRTRVDTNVSHARVVRPRRVVTDGNRKGVFPRGGGLTLGREKRCRSCHTSCVLPEFFTRFVKRFTFELFAFHIGTVRGRIVEGTFPVSLQRPPYLYKRWMWTSPHHRCVPICGQF